MKASTIWAPRILSLLRIVLGLVLLQYGLAKLFGWPVVRMFANVQWYSLWGIAGMFELVGGTLLILGLFTRPVAFILSGEMAAAYFIEHFPHSYLPILSAGDPRRQPLLCVLVYFLCRRRAVGPRCDPADHRSRIRRLKPMAGPIVNGPGLAIGEHHESGSYWHRVPALPLEPF